MYFPSLIECESRECERITEYSENGCTMHDFRNCSLCLEWEKCPEVFLSGPQLCHSYNCHDVTPTYQVATKILSGESILNG